MKRWPFLFFPATLLTHLLFLTHSSFTVWPEMILYPYLLNNGSLLFKDIINPYFPLLSIILSQAFSIFDLNVFNLKIFTYILIFFSDLIVFFSAARLTKKTAKALTTLFIYVILQVSLGGNSLWFELVLIPFVLYCLTTLYLSKRKVELTIAGLTLAIAVLIKQNAIIFYIPVFILFYKRKFENFFYFILPGLILGIAMVIYLQNYGIFHGFYKWAIQLPLSFTSQNGFVLLPNKKQYLLILFLLVPSMTLILNKWRIYEKLYWFLSSAIAMSFAFPRYENFHLQALIVFSAIFAPLMGKKKFMIFILFSIVIFLSSIAKIWHKEDRFLDKNMFLLSERIKTLDSVYLLNSPDLAYFFSGQLPPKPWASNFPWYFEQSGFEEKFIGSIRKEKIHYIVIGDRLGGGKYELGNYLPEKLLSFVYSNYYLSEKFCNFNIWEMKN